MPEKQGRLAGPAIMILSALIFGFFGFRFEWITRGAEGEFILFPALYHTCRADFNIFYNKLKSFFIK